MNDKTTQLLDIAVVSDLLGVSIQTLRRWDKEGKLVSIRLTPLGARKYDKEVIEKFIARGQKD